MDQHDDRTSGEVDLEPTGERAEQVRGGDISVMKYTDKSSPTLILASAEGTSQPAPPTP